MPQRAIGARLRPTLSHGPRQCRSSTGVVARRVFRRDCGTYAGSVDRAIDIAKEKAGIDADTDVQIVVYPPAKSVYALITDFTSISQRTALTGWLSADVSSHA